MNVSLASQLESPLLNSLQSSIVSKPFNYSLTKNYPLLAKTNVSVSPVVTPSGSVYNSRLVFKAPRYGLVTGVAFKMTVLGTAAPTNALTRTTRIGSRFFKNMSLRSHNRVIQDQWAEYSDARINNSSSEKENAYTNMTTPDVALANTATSVFYSPTFLFFGERSEASLDLGFVEPLEIVCTANDRTAMWGSDELLFDMSYTSVEAIFYYVNLENSTQAALTASQFPLSSNLTMLANDSYREVPTEHAYDFSVEGATSTITLEAKTNNVVTASHLVVRDKDANTLLPIDSVSMVSSGQTLVDSTRRSQIYENAQYDKFVHNVPGSSSGLNMYSIFYGMDSDKTYISGAEAFNGLNAPTFTVTVDTSSLSADTTLELVILHDYATLLTVSSSDGSVQRSLAN